MSLQARVTKIQTAHDAAANGSVMKVHLKLHLDMATAQLAHRAALQAIANPPAPAPPVPPAPAPPVPPPPAP